MNRVVVHYDERGEVTYYADGDVQLLIVDERAPDDRVYEWLDRDAPGAIDGVIGKSHVGNRWDGSKAARRLGQTKVN